MARVISITDGTYRFDDFYYQRIYGPRGYYADGNGAGRDFLTFSITDDRLPKKICSVLDDYWEKSGRPDSFNFYELGSGDGTLINKLMACDFSSKKAVNITAIEPLEMYRSNYSDDVQFCTSLPDGDLSGILFSNEVLDQQPFRFIRYFDYGFSEMYLVVDNGLVDALWEEVDAQQFQHLIDFKNMTWVFPLLEQARDLFQSIIQRFTGRVIFCDYGFLRTNHMYGHNWMRCIPRNGENITGVSIKDLNRTFDISTDVAFDQIIDGVSNCKVENYDLWVSGLANVKNKLWTLTWSSES